MVRSVLSLRARVALLLGSLSVFGCGTRSELANPELDTSVSPAVPCKVGTFTLRRANPTLLFVIDRSRSMLQTMPNSNGRSRWRMLIDALGSTLPAVDTSLEIGALIFPKRDAGEDEICRVVAEPELLPALNHVEPLLTLLRSSSPAGSTPTADAVEAATAALSGIRAARRARALVLATDGAPDCNSALDPNTCTCVGGTQSCAVTRCLDDARTVARIEQAAALGLPTYVVGMQDPNASALSVAALDAMARAGGRPRLGGAHDYYAATSAGELEAALTRIRDEVGSCTYLTSSVPDEEGTIAVNVNGTPLTFDERGETGWRWVARNNGELLLAPDACALLQHGDAEVEATLTCQR